MEIRTNGNLVFFLATFSRTNGNFSDFLSNETVFHCFVANSSRTNGNLAQNACTKNENGNPFVREDTVRSFPRFFYDLGNIFGICYGIFENVCFIFLKCLFSFLKHRHR